MPYPAAPTASGAAAITARPAAIPPPTIDPTAPKAQMIVDAEAPAAAAPIPAAVAPPVAAPVIAAALSFFELFA